MSLLVTARLSDPLLVAGARPGAPRTVVQRVVLSDEVNSSVPDGGQAGAGVDGGSGTFGFVSSDQSVNLAVARVPLMCETTNRPMSWTLAADGIVVVAPT